MVIKQGVRSVNMIKKIGFVLVVVAMIGGGVFAYMTYISSQTAQAATASTTTAPLAKGNLTASIMATGKVRSNQTATLTWQTTGTVEKVNYTEGSSVKTGDILASLEQTSLPQSIILAQADLTSAQQALEKLNREAESAKITAMQNIVTYEGDVKDAQYTLDNFTIPSNQAGMDAVEAVKVMKERLEEARTAFAPYKFLASSDKTRTALLETFNEAQADYNAAVKRLQYEYDLEVAQANLESAHLDYEKYKNGPVDADVKAAQANIAAAEATLQSISIKAPFSGVLTQVDVQVGDRVSAGTNSTSASDAFRLDDMKTLYVDVDVSETDIHQVQTGQDATIVLDALQGTQYHGKVVKVAMFSADTSTAVNFTVAVSLTDADENVRPGMTAEVEIITSSRENVLLIPNEAIQMVNDKPVVYIQNAGQTTRTPVEVTLGVSSDTYTELVSGDLKEGDEVILNPSGSTAQSNNAGGLFGGPGGPPPDGGGGPQPQN
jgi:HlyD family secretion protein